MENDDQIIIIKKKGGHAAHHGGAWKVAYADFVTAMMALFIVLWLMNSSKPVQEAVGGYFRDPYGTAQNSGTKPAGASETGVFKKEEMTKLKDELKKAMEKMANFDRLKNRIEMTVTPEGLRIELMEDPKGTFFENGKAQPTPILENLLKVLSSVAGKLPNTISIEGHTDSQPFAARANYTNWELSADRANASRRLMQQHGLRADQVAQVRGFADQQPRNAKDPSDPANRRITVIVQYLDQKPPDVAVPTPAQSAPPAPSERKP